MQRPGDKFTLKKNFALERKSVLVHHQCSPRIMPIAPGQAELASARLLLPALPHEEERNCFNPC